MFKVRACSLRLTNVYGPRQLLKHNRQGFIGWFIRLALEDATINIYGDGSQLRDFVYVDDAADAFLRAGADDACNGEVFNVGGSAADQPSRADRAADRTGRRRTRGVTPTGPPRRRRSTSATSTPTRRSSPATTGWRPLVPLPTTDCSARWTSIVSTSITTSIRLRRLRSRRESLRAFRSRLRRPREDADRRSTQRSSASCRAAGSSSARRSRRSSTNSPQASGAAHAVGVGNGTDALALILQALGIGAGDEVITSPLSAAYTALAVIMAGARPVFADIDPLRLTIDPAAVERAVTLAHARAAAGSPLRPGRGHDRTRARSPSATICRSSRTAARLTLPRQPGGRLGPLASPARSVSIRRRTSARWATAARSSPATPPWPSESAELRNGGQTDRYRHQEAAGVNSRLDELQAAILRARLPFLARLDRGAASDSPPLIAPRFPA